MSQSDPDPRGLIRESYLIEGVTDAQCRSIFLDWAIGLPADATPQAEILRVLDLYGASQPDHPMTAVLRAGLEAGPGAGRRGGRAARFKD